MPKTTTDRRILIAQREGHNDLGLGSMIGFVSEHDRYRLRAWADRHSVRPVPRRRVPR